MITHRFPNRFHSLRSLTAVRGLAETLAAVGAMDVVRKSDHFRALIAALDKQQRSQAMRAALAVHGELLVEVGDCAADAFWQEMEEWGLLPRRESRPSRDRPSQPVSWSTTPMRGRPNLRDTFTCWPRPVNG